nr:flap endonuclease GEN 1 [Hymenolepis microstoma]
MGVHGLWTILSPIQDHIPLRSLGGKKLAVDLSGWVCGDMYVNQRVQTGCKLYLRNLVFRLTALLRESILPIAVTDGTAPVIKAQAMQCRRQFSRLNSSNDSTKPISLKRSQFSRISAQCGQLLRALGIPCIGSPGEAEAMCAFLDMENLVDGCVTNDGDVFLYGAKVVYRHFSLNSRDASVEAYYSEHITTRVGLCQKSLVLLSLVLGCDYWPQGVPGVGPVSAGRALAQVDINEALNRLSKGSDACSSSSDADKVWSSPIWRKITRGLTECPVTHIVEEFLMPWIERGWQMPKSKSLQWTRPNVRQAVEFCINFLDWQPSYALAQFTPLLALWIIRSSNAESFVGIMEPLRIVKKRSVNYVACFEVEWSRLNDDIWSGGVVDLGSRSTESLITSLSGFFTESGYRFPVPAVEFRSAFPQLADTFEIVESLPDLTAKMDSLSIDGSRIGKKKVKKLRSKKDDVKKKSGPLMNYLQLNKENEPSGVPDKGLPPWNSPINSPVKHPTVWKIRPAVDEVFTPSPVNQCKKAPPQNNFISVRLSTQFERRLTLESSLLAPDTPPRSPGVVEFENFQTPARLRDSDKARQCVDDASLGFLRVRSVE